MRHCIFEPSDKYQVALLIKSSAFNKHELQRNYVTPLNQLGIASQQVIGFTLDYNEAGKAPVKYIKAYLDHLLVALDSLGVTYLYVADSAYFKVLTRMPKAEPHYGYCLPCKIEGFEHMQVVLGLHYQQLIYNPDLQARMDMTLTTLADSVQGTYQALGQGIIHSAHYPETVSDIAQALQSLHQYEHLTCDIEAFSLAFNEAGIGTIAFAWDQHNGMAFACDYHRSILDDGSFHPDYVAPETNIRDHGFFKVNRAVRRLLLKFFLQYKGTLIWHNASYDVRTIIYTLWMADPLDNMGLLDGLEVMSRHFGDSKIVAYLATNSTAGNQLSLKHLAHEFAGNWAVEDIKDIRLIHLPDLLQYNLVDTLSTWFVYNKYYPIMVQDKQEELYYDLMLPSLKVIIQMELTGMPMSEAKIADAKAELERLRDSHLAVLQNSPLIRMLTLIVQKNAQVAANAKLKTKQHPLEHFSAVTFNPGSGPQVQHLLYELMGLPVIDLTDTKQPATGADTLEKLINHTQNAEYKAIIQALIGYGKVTKILSTFITAFEKGVRKVDGMIYLHGGYNLGGTVSGRLSSSKPNMQNIPSGSTYGELIKSCFAAPKGWLFVGADFNSLEDYISALTTKDPNKLNVYLKGYDGHCLRAAYYFKEDLLARGIHIALEDPTSVNSIKTLAADLRQDSKAPTFLLTYGGTYHGMMKNLGWPEDKARIIEDNYHSLYVASDEYIQRRLEQASKDGYVEVAFGLRVRTPLLSQVVFGGNKVPYEAQAEGRTAGNAMGQSYGLLNNRAANDFMQKVWKSPYRHDIKIVAQIHDAAYLLVRDHIDVVDWVNKELIKSMQWQELPELQHDTVKLGAEMDIYWPDWSCPITLPNNATQEEIMQICGTHLQEIKGAA